MPLPGTPPPERAPPSYITFSDACNRKRQRGRGGLRFEIKKRLFSFQISKH
nr:MAG TPA: hypothetical protein [Caudoviricetes sp.]